MSEHEPSQQFPPDEILNLHGRLQIEIAHRALQAAHIEGHAAHLLRILLEIDTQANDTTSQPYVALGGKAAGAVRAQILMSLELMIISDETSDNDRLAARELRDIMTTTD